MSTIFCSFALRSKDLVKMARCQRLGPNQTASASERHQEDGRKSNCHNPLEIPSAKPSPESFEQVGRVREGSVSRVEHYAEKWPSGSGWGIQEHLHVSVTWKFLIHVYQQEIVEWSKWAGLLDARIQSTSETPPYLSTLPLPSLHIVKHNIADSSVSPSDVIDGSW